MTMNGSPVPVPKQSLFKAKGVTGTPGGKTHFAVDSVTGVAAALIDEVKTNPEAAKVVAAHLDKMSAIADKVAEGKTSGAPAVQMQGVPLIKAKAAQKAAPYAGDGLVPVLIPLALAQSIASKPSTGGGWQALMGELQKVLAVNEVGLVGVYSHVLHLTPALLNKLIDKATLYGPGGGYQGVMKSIVCFAVKQHPGLILKGGA